MSKKISERQMEILEYIKSEILAKGYPPTVREIGEAVHLKSTSSVHAHLDALENKGYIRRDPTKPRAIEILDDDFQMAHTEFANVPIVGNVAAGQPILAEENIEGYFPFPLQYLPHTEGNDLFMLKVRGDSMINIGIMNGDLVIAEAAREAYNGEIVIALIDDSSTVKRFYKENGHIRLQPENDNMDPIIVPDCQILGKVIASVRTYS